MTPIRSTERLQLPARGVSLDADALQRLSKLVTEAEQRQVREIASALDAALRQVPPLLRPLLRKALGL